MKKILFLIVVSLSVNGFVSAQTIIPGGEVSGTWTKANSPYLIQGAIMIANDSTLTIEPGVSVIFQGGYKLLVLGRLLAVGTVTDSITFTAADTAIGWRGIRFDNTPATNDTSKIFYCKLSYGKASGSGDETDGGALHFRNFSKAIVYNSYIFHCVANGIGGGISCFVSSPTISNNTISNNSAVFEGGGVDCSGNSIISNNIIKGNSAYSGGGVYCSIGSPIISNNTISNNSVIFFGGGIHCFGCSPTISNNTISNNSAQSDGSGIYCSGSSAIIFNNSITNNSNSDYGGGIYSSGGNPTISDNTISNNSASSGSGIYSGDNTSITNNIISNNSAFDFGGGIYYSGKPTILNNIIYNNSASLFGGGIYCSNDTVSMINNTISNNTAQKGGALYCSWTSNPNIYNSLVWGNTATIAGNQIYLDDESSDPNFYFCDVEGGKAGFGLNTNVNYLGTYSNNIDADPLFVDTTIADWSLQATSPCINAGDSSGTYPSTDKAGNPRICGGRIDIGAFEFQASPCITAIANINKPNEKITLYPNPTNGKFQLAISNMQIVNGELKIYNVLGENVFQSDFFNPITEINMNGLADQIYLVRIKINEQVYFRKISKIK